MRLSLLAVVPVLVVACSTFGSDDNGGSSGPGPGAGEDSGLDPVTGTAADEALLFNALPKDPVFVTQGSSAKITLNIVRGRNVPDPITVTVEGLPTGVATPLLQFGIGEAKADLVIQAAGDAAQGAIHAKVRATSGKLTTVTAIELFVRGAPGALDTTFGDKGFAGPLVGDGKANFPTDLKVLTDGRILAIGQCNVVQTTVVNNASATCVIRLSTDGQRDTSYGAGGISSIALSMPVKAAPASNGRIVVLGGGDSFEETNKVRLARLNADGTRDTTFGVNGVCEPLAGPAGTTFLAGAVDLVARPTDGSLFAEFTYRASSPYMIGILKVGPNCESAPSFGDAGVVGVSWSTSTRPLGLVLRGEAPIVTGRAHVDSPTFGTAQLDGSTGGLDLGFGTSGLLTWSAASKPANALTQFSGVVVLPTGAVVGNFPLANGFALTSIDPGGKALSPGFATSGAVSVTTTGTPTDLVRQADGKLLVNISASGTADVRRFSASGAPDSGFGKAGTFADARFSSKRVALQNDGRIVVLGQFGKDLALVRLWN